MEGSQRAEPPALARAAEALQATAGLGAHAGGAAAARCGARASREGGGREGEQEEGAGSREGGRAALRPPPAFKELGRSARSGRALGPGRSSEPRAGGRAGGLGVGAQGAPCRRGSACTHPAEARRPLLLQGGSERGLQLLSCACENHRSLTSLPGH